jgi:hypothetical protein
VWLTQLRTKDMIKAVLSLITIGASYGQISIGGGGTIAPSNQVYFATQNGLKCDGVTDDTSAINALLTTVSATGGTILMPAATCLISGLITLPNNSASPPRQKSIRMTGMGSSANTVANAEPFIPYGGSILDMRYSASGGNIAKIQGLGAGIFEIDHMTLMDGGTDATPFIFVTNTILRAHDLSIYGTPHGSGAIGTASTGTTVVTLSNNGTGYLVPPIVNFINGTCSIQPLGTAVLSGTSVGSVSMTQGVCTVAPAVQFYAVGNDPAIVLGGITTNFDGTNTSSFQAYSTVIDSVFFDFVGRAVLFQCFANAVQFTNNTVWGNAGGIAPLDLNGNANGSSCGAYGNYFGGNLLELVHYQYAVRMNVATWNVFSGNGFWDISSGTFIAWLNLANSQSNVFLMGYQFEDSSIPKVYGGNGSTQNNLWCDGQGCRNNGSAPGNCATFNDIGRTYFNTQSTTTTTFNACMSVAGTVGWVQIKP